MKKKLKKIEVLVENRVEPFKKKKEIATNYLESETYHIWNTHDIRSRRYKWKPTNYVRSNSRPGFLRTVSRNDYMRENSKFRRGSEINRIGSLTAGNFAI